MMWTGIPFCPEASLRAPVRFGLPSTALALLLACAPPIAVAPPAAPSLNPAEFSGLISALSEPGGFFPSENLVSNETSYLHVMGTLDKLGTRGGAYIGVGPDQNFSWIARIRPEIAFIIDIRRDNLLQHLLFKALFLQARNRLEYLCLMTGTPPPADLVAWDDAEIVDIVAYVDSTNATPELMEGILARVHDTVLAFGHPLDVRDSANLRRIQLAFFEEGLGIRYSNRGRWGFYPTWRQLILAEDLEGSRAGYLASEAEWRFVKDMQRRNMIIPIVGNLAGPYALKRIGDEIAGRGLVVSALYVSNVEQYLFQQGAFTRFGATVAGLPYADHSVIIRSYFRGGHPQNVAGHRSTQILERIADFDRSFVQGVFRTYFDVVTRNALPLREP